MEAQVVQDQPTKGRAPFQVVRLLSIVGATLVVALVSSKKPPKLEHYPNQILSILSIHA